MLESFLYGQVNAVIITKGILKNVLIASKNKEYIIIVMLLPEKINS
jgi:hypothetical protein